MQPKAHFFVMGAALLGSFAVAGAAEDRALAEHRRLWEAANLDAYVYAYNKYCECHAETPPETFVSVRSGEVVDVRHQPFGYDHYVQAEPRNFQWYWTVEQLFELAESAIARGSEVSVEYDGTLGYPTRLYIDHDADLIGDELDLRLTRLDPLDE
jgi:hypothetical protein